MNYFHYAADSIESLRAQRTIDDMVVRDIEFFNERLAETIQVDSFDVDQTIQVKTRRQRRNQPGTSSINL